VFVQFVPSATENEEANFVGGFIFD